MKLYEITIGQQVLDYSEELQKVKLKPKVHDALQAIGAQLLKMGFEWKSLGRCFQRGKQFVYPLSTIGKVRMVVFGQYDMHNSWSDHDVPYSKIWDYSEGEIEDFFK